MKTRMAPGELGKLTAMLLGDGLLAQIAAECDCLPLELFGANRKSERAARARALVTEWLRAHVGWRYRTCECCRGEGRVDGVRIRARDGQFVTCPACEGRGRVRVFETFAEQQDLEKMGFKPLSLPDCARELGCSHSSIVAKRRLKATDGRRKPKKSKTRGWKDELE